MRKMFLCCIMLLLMLVTACSKDTEEAANEEVEEQEEVVVEEEEEPEEPEFKHIYPLTGIGTNEDVNHRIVSVMVNNHSAARPQSGLSKADIVFEILAEANITRFLALFHSEQPEVVGPVRSAREYYFELANDYGAIYVYHGADQFINDMIYERNIDYIDGFYNDNDGVLFKRESFRKAPHNSYFQFGEVYRAAEDRGYDIIADIEPLPFLGEDEQPVGEDATQIDIAYSSSPADVVTYTYDSETGSYFRYSGGELTVELDTEEPIKVENVFVVETSHRVFDEVGRREIDLKTSGQAILFQGGKMQRLEWVNKDGRIIPVKDGQPVGFIPGKTWVNVVPTSPGLDQSVQVSNE